MRATLWRPLMLTVVVLTAGLAGCAGSDDGVNGGTDGPGDGQDGDSDPIAEIPRWELGDAWTFDIKTEGFPASTTTMMVYDQTADLYRIGSTDETQAFIHALFNVNPQLGRIQKGNLGVFEDGEPRAMYQFPIEDGSTWTTEFFVSQHGGTLNAEATYNPAIQTQTPAGEVEGFEIVAENSQGFRVEYDYIPEFRWFSEMVVVDSDGTELHTLTLTDHSRANSGTAYFVRGSDIYDEAFAPGDCGWPVGCQNQVLVDGESDPRDDGQYDLVAMNVQVAIQDSDNDRAQVTIEDAGGNEMYSRQFLQSQQNEFKFEVVEDFEPGEWQVQVALQGQASAQVRLAGGWSYSGSV